MKSGRRFYGFLVAAFVFALMGSMPPQWWPSWLEKAWDVPAVHTVGSFVEKSLGSCMNNTWVGKKVPRKNEGELRFSELATRKESAIADGRVDGRGQFRAVMHGLSLVSLIAALLCLPAIIKQMILSHVATGLLKAPSATSAGSAAAAGPSVPAAASAASSPAPAGSSSAPASGGNGGKIPPSGAATASAAAPSATGTSGAATATADPQTATASEPQTGSEQTPKSETPAVPSLCQPMLLVSMMVLVIENLTRLFTDIFMAEEKVKAEAMAKAAATATEEASAKVTAEAPVKPEAKQESQPSAQPVSSESSRNADMTLTWTVIKPGQEKESQELKLEGSKIAEAMDISIKLEGMYENGTPSEVEVRIS